MVTNVASLDAERQEALRERRLIDLLSAVCVAPPRVAQWAWDQLTPAERVLVPAQLRRR